MRDKLRQLARLLDPRDAIALGGLVVFGYGLHMMYPPLAYLFGGALIFWIGARTDGTPV